MSFTAGQFSCRLFHFIPSLYGCNAIFKMFCMFIRCLNHVTRVLYICGSYFKVLNMISQCTYDKTWCRCWSQCTFQENGMIPHPLSMQFSHNQHSTWKKEVMSILSKFLIWYVWKKNVSGYIIPEVWMKFCTIVQVFL